MTIGIKDLVDQINSEIDSPANDSTRVSQLAGATTFNTYSVPTVDALPLASENTGRFILVLSSDSYYFSDGTKWTNKVESTVGYIKEPWIWGRNTNGGLLVDGTTTNKCSPVPFQYTITGWSDISAGSLQLLALRNDNTLWSWGCNNVGQLGDGTTVNKSSPVSIVGGFSDWNSISAGIITMSATRRSGTAWSWGCNNCGQLGDGTTVNKSSPALIAGGITDWKKTSVGSQSSAGLRFNGTIFTWGLNTTAGAAGQLGDNTTVNKSSPVAVVGGFTDWCDVSVGLSHMAAVRANGTAWTWGYNRCGQLGDNTTVLKSSPVSVVGGFTDWCQISASCNSTIAVRQNGTAWAWGCNTLGQLGDGTTVNQSSPVSVVGGFTDWCFVNIGYKTATGIRSNGTAWAWGCNIVGQLGDGTETSRSSPVSVVGGFTDWNKASTNGQQTVMFRYTPKGF